MKLCWYAVVFFSKNLNYHLLYIYFWRISGSSESQKMKIIHADYIIISCKQ